MPVATRGTDACRGPVRPRSSGDTAFQDPIRILGCGWRGRAGRSRQGLDDRAADGDAAEVGRGRWGSSPGSANQTPSNCAGAGTSRAKRGRRSGSAATTSSRLATFSQAATCGGNDGGGSEAVGHDRAAGRAASRA